MPDYHLIESMPIEELEFSMPARHLEESMPLEELEFSVPDARKL